MKTISLKCIPIVVIFVVTAPLAFLSLPFFVLYQKMVARLLEIKHGTKFLGHFTDLDAMHVRSKFGISIINVLLVIECEEEEKNVKVSEIISELIYNELIKKGSKLPKFCSSLQNFLGYPYMLRKENITVSDCVKTLKIRNDPCAEISKEQLIDIINEYALEPFPRTNQLMWDVHVGMQPVQWRTNKGKKYYPVLFRFHHGIADGINLSKFLTGVCSDNQDNKPTDAATTLKTPVVKNHYLEIVKLTAHWCTVYLFYPTMLYVFLFIKNQNHPKISAANKGRQVGIVVDHTDKYFMKVKEIVRNHRRASFTSIISAAFSGSLRNHYLKKNRLCPKYLATIQISHPSALGLLELQPGSLNTNEVHFRNEYNSYQTLISIAPQESHNNESLINQLNVIVEYLNFDKNSVISKISQQYMLTFLTFAPYPFSAITSMFGQYGAIISNMPGTKKISLGNNRLTVCDYVVCVPEPKGVSATVITTTYDRRLVVSISIQSSLLSEPNDLQDILDNMYEQIEMMAKELHTARFQY